MDAGEFTDSEIIVMLGENGTGKTTLVRMLHGSLKPDEEGEVEIPEFRVSYKPQKISPKFPGSVRFLSGLAAGSWQRPVSSMLTSWEDTVRAQRPP